MPSRTVASMNHATAAADKLRKACDECNSAKVKCSGEKSGCHRCMAAGRECIYGQSRVGKVPGLRSQRRRLPSESDSSRHIPPGIPASPSSLPTSRNRPGSRHAFSEGMTDWDIDFGPSLPSSSMPMEDVPTLFDASFAVETPVPLGTSTITTQSLANSSTTTTRTSPPSSADCDSDLVETFAPPSVMDLHQTSRAYRRGPDPSTPVRNDPKHTTKLESRCVTICCAIITHLEKYIEARVIGFSIVSGSIKKAIDTLNQLVTSQRPTSNPRCHHLFAVIMYQIIELLESGSATFIQGSDGDAESNELITFDQMETLLSDFMFGGVPVDSGEQRSLRARLVLRELHRVREIHRRILDVIQVHGAPDAAVITSQMACHREVETRIQKLIDDVKRSEG